MAKRAIRNGPPSAFGQNVDKPPKAATTFPFLRLPPEIRNTVYALIIPTVVRLSPPPTADKKSCGCWALAHVSKEIRKEFLPVFYSTARLTIDLQHEAGEALWSQWITSVGDSWIALVKHLVIEAKIEVERSLSRNRGYFFQNRIFERMNYMIDCPHATGGIEVNSEWEEREEVATYSQCAFRGPDKEWEFTFDRGEVILAMEEALEEGHASEDPGSRRETIRSVVATVWRHRSFWLKV